ncbi:MAG TPA: MlaD family protein [Pseudonocardia sp.]|jgi:phospholipid/cholesterol/gamma-HCH transport system substrate-binding protein
MPNVKPELRNDARSVLAGLLILVLVGVAMWVTTVAQSGHFLPVKSIKMAFTDVHTLQMNDDLRMYGSRIGRISAINYQDGEAVITAELINEAPPIYKNASAQVLSVSPLALKYVNIDPGTPSGGKLGDGEVIPGSQDIGSSDLQDILDVLDKPTRLAATSTLRQVGFGLAGHGQDLNDFVGSSPDLLRNLGTVSDSLASPDFDMTGVLGSVDRLTRRLDDRQAQLRSLIDKARVTLASIGVDNGQPLRATLRQAPTTLRDLNTALVSLKAPLGDVQSFAQTVRPGAGDFGATVPDLRGTLTEGVPVLDQVPDFSDRAKPAVDHLNDTFTDARPLAPKLRDAFKGLSGALGGLAPYGPEIGQFFTRGHSFVSEGPAPNIRYARFDLAFSATQGTGGLFGSKNFPRDSYPRPGVADHEAYHGAVPSGIVPGGAPASKPGGAGPSLGTDTAPFLGAVSPSGDPRPTPHQSTHNTDSGSLPFLGVVPSTGAGR